MPKHKKTREEKIKADGQRASFETTGQYRFSFSPASPLKPTHTTTIADTTKTVRHDLMKTAIISSTILALQMILFMLLKNHALAFGFVRY